MAATVRLTVFGATGRTGRHVLEQGLSRGHAITAFTRRPHELESVDSRVTVVRGDGRDPRAVLQAIEGADAAILIIPGGSRKDPHVATDVARTVVGAMIQAGTSRLVVTSAYPIVGSGRRSAILRLLFATPYADVRAMEGIVSTSQLDWTIARLNRLSNRQPTGNLHITPDLLPRPVGLSRSDAATALLDIVEEPTLARIALNIAGGK
jgi:putative NADH-flavin reductase